MCVYVHVCMYVSCIDCNTVNYIYIYTMCCMTYDIQQHLTKSSRDCNAHNGHYGGSGAAQRRTRQRRRRRLAGSSLRPGFSMSRSRSGAHNEVELEDSHGYRISCFGMFWKQKKRESPKNNSVTEMYLLLSLTFLQESSRCMSGFPNIIPYDRLWKASGELKAPLHHHSICSVQTGKVPW